MRILRMYRIKDMRLIILKRSNNKERFKEMNILIINHLREEK